MKKMKISSWNVNGIRSVLNKGFLAWLEKSTCDIVCLQEVRCAEDKIPTELTKPFNYFTNWHAAQKSGYSGVGFLSKTEPLKVWRGLGLENFDQEGRVIAGEWEHLIVINAYFPNSQDEGKRLGFKVEFCKSIHSFANKLSKSKKKPVLLCGDYNIAPKPIDLARPEANEFSPGYFKEERDWMNAFLDSGWSDLFRQFYPDQKEAYTWWSFRTRARERNVGWRIDHVCMPSADQNCVEDVQIEAKVMGSDHCPVTVFLKF